MLERAKQYDIPTFLFDRSALYEQTSVLRKLQALKVDFIVLAGFLWLLPESIIDNYPQKIVNLHPALLPKYSGKDMYGMRVHQAIALAKEVESGITIHYVNEGYDTGQIIFQQKCSLSTEDTPESIAEKVHQLEYKHYPKVIEAVLIE